MYDSLSFILRKDIVTGFVFDTCVKQLIFFLLKLGTYWIQTSTLSMIDYIQPCNQPLQDKFPSSLILILTPTLTLHVGVASKPVLTSFWFKASQASWD